MLTVYYNTRCPVCVTGISRQQRKLIEAVKAGVITFREINLEPEALSAYGATLEDVRKKLHAVDENGTLYVGAPVAAEIWKRTPGEAWLGKLISLPVIRQLSAGLYNVLAFFLYRWNRRKGHW